MIKNEEYTLFLDMDGVLADFEKGFQDIAGLSFNDYASKHGDQSALQYFQLRRNRFWEDLEWERGGKEVYNTAKKYYKTVKILSSAGTVLRNDKFFRVESGKKKWVQKNNVEVDEVIIVADKSEKIKYSDPLSILVDDNPVTIKAWNAAGGLGILHISRHYEDTIDELISLASPISLHEIVKKLKNRGKI